MSRRRRKAELVVHTKETSPKGLVREVVIWRIPKSIRYPNGFRYRLALVNPETSEILVLIDNHWPKGHHRHRRNKEEPYFFEDLKRLIADFKVWSEDEEKRHES